jgi:DNA modification methylase
MIALANADSRRIPLSDQSVQCVITSPPYWGLRDYGHSDQIGLESTPALYVASIVAVMREVWRVLKDDGVLWLNLGDSYASGEIGRHDAKTDRAYGKRDNGQRQQSKIDTGLKPKDLVGIPWRVAFALQEDGWYLRSDIIWHKPNPMPESVTDRPTKAHEYVFLLTKQARYYYDAEAIKESSGDTNSCRLAGNATNTNYSKKKEYRGLSGLPDNDQYTTRNRRSVWTVATSPYSGAHFATFPPALVEPMVLAGTSARGECPVCGKAWVRVVEKDTDQPEGYGNMGENGSKWLEEDKQSSGHRIQKNMNALRAAGRDHDNPFPKSTTTGWRPQCDCPPHDPVPQIVLDPFAGSGTVGQVCRESGRSFVGFDLSLKYLHDNAMPRAQNTNTSASMATLPMFAEAQA